MKVLNVVDGCIPSDMATGSTPEIEEERRLLYVAMTRAQDELELISPQRFFIRQQNAYGDRHVYALPSRFIPESIDALFECRAESCPVQAEEGAETERIESPAKIDVAQRIRAGWKRAG